MAFQILLETCREPRQAPEPGPCRWRERNGVLFINQKRGRKPKPRLRGPVAQIIDFPEAPIEPLLREHARALWAVNKILYPDDEEIISFTKFAKYARKFVNMFRGPLYTEVLEIQLGMIRRQLADANRCLEDHAKGEPLWDYYAMGSLKPIQRGLILEYASRE